MTTVYDTEEDGNIIVVFDTRWRFPETLGYSSDNPEYKELQRMWEESTGGKIKKEDTDGRTGERQGQDK